VIEQASGLAALFGLVFALGMRHGFDPDHLATIDSMARASASRRPHLARWTGCLFSLGHGAVVTLVAAVIGMYSMQWDVRPGWTRSAHGFPLSYWQRWGGPTCAPR
jgi:high-affinity nickel permease